MYGEALDNVEWSLISGSAFISFFTLYYFCIHDVLAMHALARLPVSLNCPFASIKNHLKFQLPISFPNFLCGLYTSLSHKSIDLVIFFPTFYFSKVVLEVLSYFPHVEMGF